MSGALKYRSGATWNYVKGVKGDTGSVGPIGPQGPPTISVGSLTPPGIGRARLAYDGTTLSLQNDTKLFLNDYPGVDPTGATECSAAIQAALDYAATSHIYEVWCAPSSIYKIGTQLDVPRAITVAGPIRRGQPTYPSTLLNQPQFKANASGMTIFRLVGNASNLRGIALHLGDTTYTGNVGVRPNNHLQTVEHCMFQNGDVTSTGIRGGGILYFTAQHNYWYSFAGRGIDMLNAYSDVPLQTYYGVNVGWIKYNTIGTGQAGAIRFDGMMDVIGNDFESTFGNGPVIEFGSASYGGNGECRGNYFELTGNPSQAMLVTNGTPDIHHNMVLGALGPTVGSYGVKFVAPTAAHLPHDNTFGRFETAISVTAISAGLYSFLMLGNYYLSPQITTPVSGGPTGWMSSGGSPLTSLADRGDRRLTYDGALTGGAIMYSIGGDTAIDLSRGNLFHLQATANLTLTYTNRVDSGQRITLVNTGTGTITLPFANWLTREGVNAMLQPGDIRVFVTSHNGYGFGTKPREVVPATKLPVVKTATFTADASADAYFCDATTGAITANLPTATTWTGGPLTVKKTDASANAVTVDPNGTQTIDGAATLALTAQWSAVTVRPSGGNWLVVGKVN